MLDVRAVLGAGAIVLTAAAVAAAPKQFTEEEVTAAVTAAIAERSHDGIFPFVDARSGEALALVPDDVRVVRGLPGFGWFPNVNFHDQAQPAKKYALDFWLKPEADRLKLLAVRIHKAPQPDGASWMSITRAPLPWWWLPTIERASAVAGMPAWQVMGMIHTHIVEEMQGEAVVVAGEDGTRQSLQLVDIEQPVGRSRADGRYFACALLRKFGSEHAFYARPYWLDAKTKLVTAGSLTSIEEARGERKAATEPHCDVGGIAYDIVD